MREQIAKLRASIAELESLRSQAGRADGYRKRAEALAKPARRLRTLAATARLMRQRRLSVRIQAPSLPHIRRELAALQAQFAQDPDSILKGDNQRQYAFWKPLAALPDQVEEQLKRVWVQWIRATLPGGQDELLQVLERFPAFAGAVREIRTCARQAELLAQQLPAEEADFDAVLALARRMRQAWDQLAAADLSDEVKRFLLKASEGKATLADLTSPVLAWIQGHHLLGAFHVSIGGNRIGR